jgi:hypothetical protein
MVSHITSQLGIKMPMVELIALARALVDGLMAALARAERTGIDRSAGTSGSRRVCATALRRSTARSAPRLVAPSDVHRVLELVRALASKRAA